MQSRMEPSCYVDLRQINVISCLYLLGFCLKVAQQAVECFLVGIMVFPRAKVTDIALMTNIGNPSERTIESCLFAEFQVLTPLTFCPLHGIVLIDSYMTKSP